ncbi:hypothetical protein FB45DRAFT_896622 [Roridomyces roridus]|uniref:Telomere-associated protein Rif1 N-terminal domain-containing protein n=1 Tax=Roridomyces roridus TaxID=1738132 RepID=A0AAD7CAV4_9AGAR|nr:hypothetical protein FB45DRAFT_896622 [Roridomyces roridus]
MSSSLPTPPNTSHREKENRIPLGGRRVVWSPQNDYRTITPLHHAPPPARAIKSLPTKSILKKPSQLPLPMVDVFQRETTPEPSEPKFDATYLASHVSVILDVEASLDALIRAYSVLAARLRAHITLTTDADGSWPILDPLRENRAAFHLAVVRDLERCLVDPDSMAQTAEDIEEEASIRNNQLAAAMLPSPKSSPKKKKKGTTAKKAKYGRDLCTTCHSVLKLLGVVFTLPAVYALFTTPQLALMLTQVLAIPLADELPTPNARKTYALAIWLLQTQRLPTAVLEPAADRIVFALRRGIEGELGKEGKKGSASDGLKAIHDFSVYHPSIFVPKFEDLLPSVLANLLAPTVAIRALACHALGGFARGLATLPVSALHTRISAAIVEHLTVVSSSPARKSASPTKSSNEAALVRTLRTTLQATEVQHVSQGPVWGLSILAALLVLANSAVYAHDRARRVFIALLSQAMTHKKSSVRSLGCAVWRSAAWAYCQPLLPDNDEGESEVEEEDEVERKQKQIQQGREIFWQKIVVTIVDMGVGLSTVAALLQEAEPTIEDCITRVSTVLKNMSGKGGANLICAIEALEMMLSFDRPACEWNWSKLLPRGLFTASPGLLTAEFNAIETTVRSILAQCPGTEDVRPLTREEVAQPVVFEKLVEVWKECLGALGLADDASVPTNMVSIWENLIQANVSALQEGEAPDSDISGFAIQAVDILVDILLDSNIDVTLKSGEVRYCTDGLEPTNSLSNAALKLKIVSALWGATRRVITNSSQLFPAAEKLLFILMKSEDEFTDSGEVSRADWASLCAEVLVICDPEDVQEFWKYDGAAHSKWEWTSETRSLVWRCFVEKWKGEKEAVWQAIVILLAVPFMAHKNWDFNDSDYTLWESLLGHGIDKALDYGLDAVSVVDHVAAAVAKEHNPASTATCLVADALLAHLPMEDARELPETLFEFINEVVLSNYPPEPRNKQQALWTLRSVARAIEKCPPELVLDLMRIIEGGLCTWISDEHGALGETEYAYDIVTLYQVVLMKISTLSPSLQVLESFGPVLEAGFTCREGSAIVDAFTEFWQVSYSKEPVPRGGWPAEIQTCLDAAFDEPEPVEPWDKVVLSPAFCGEPVVDASSPSESPFKLSPARFRSVSLEPVDASTAHELCRPSTPTASTPPRPLKMPIFASPSASPSYQHPSTPKRTPLRVVSGSTDKPSPSKRRKLFDNKENESPRIASVMERIISASPKSGHDVAGASKKHASPDRPRDERPLKRRALGEAGQSDVDEERAVEFALQADPEEITPLTKKRKRYLLDGVEVPTLRQVYSQEVLVTPTENRVQTRSTSKAMMRRVSEVSRKRRRDSDSDEDPFLERKEIPSSDDDAYFGQVTPFHVYSPVPRRMRDDDPPSSDDSSMSVSPLKGKVARPVQKMGSASRIVSL